VISLLASFDFADHKVKDFKAGFLFLEEHYIIRRERNNTQIYLYKFWKAEMDIANGIGRLLSAPESSQGNFVVDLSRSDTIKLLPPILFLNRRIIRLNYFVK